MKSKLLYLIASLTILLLVNWGETGHQKINYSSSFSFNNEMSQFLYWASLLSDHASDADDRKYTDPNEAPKHYIDIDSYPEFVSNGTINQSYSENVTLHGYTFVIDQGILPWATITAYDSLVQSFINLDWNQAMLYASDLGHYIADGHMPLHICANYNGQLSGQTGIHSRYESTMINYYINQISYSGESIQYISNVSDYVFDYIYANYVYVDSVLYADSVAHALANSYTSTLYKQTLWQYSQSFTINLFKNASLSLAELIYSAWIDAGSPLINPTGFINNYVNENKLSVFPNPFSSNAIISFSVEKPKSNVSLKIYNSSGLLVTTLVNENKEVGEYKIEYDSVGLQAGIYFSVLNVDKKVSLVKIIKQ